MVGARRQWSAPRAAHRPARQTAGAARLTVRRAAGDTPDDDADRNPRSRVSLRSADDHSHRVDDGAVGGRAVPRACCPDCERLTGGEPLTAGDELTLSYSGFQPGEQVTVVMRSTPVELGTFTVDASGTVTANVTIPASAETGSHTLTLSGPVTGDQVLRFRLWAQRDDVAGPASDGTGLAMPLALGGAGLVLLAVGGLVLYRRRAATSAEPDHPAQGQPTETPISEPIP